MKITNFVTPPEHINFLAKNLFGNCGEIINGSIAYLEPNGGGPVQLHTHEHEGNAQFVSFVQTSVL